MNILDLYNILLSDTPSTLIKENEDEIFKLIPELKVCKGFNQHNIWHIYDVYEHILHVVDNTPKVLELRLAALFHDIGKPLSFTLDEEGVGHFKGHWNESIKILSKYQDLLNLDDNKIDLIKNLIYYHDLNLCKLSEKEIDDIYNKLGRDGYIYLYMLKRSDLLAQNPIFNDLLKEYDQEESYTLNRYGYNLDLISILLTDDVEESINDNIDYLLNIIPEIKEMIGFDQNHPHHHLDVWNHTLLALSLSEFDLDVRIALLLHDIGKPYSYQDDEVRHFYNHANKSADISNIVLKRLGFNDKYINYICLLIKHHDLKITEEEIKDNYDFSLKLYNVQKCDALAHHPDKLEKRKIYLDEIDQIFKRVK